MFNINYGDEYDDEDDDYGNEYDDEDEEEELGYRHETVMNQQNAFGLQSRVTGRLLRTAGSHSLEASMRAVESRDLRTVIKQLVELIGFVKHGIGAKLRAAFGNVVGGVIGKHHYLLVVVALLASLEYAQPTALFEEQVDNGELPIPVMV